MTIQTKLLCAVAASGFAALVVAAPAEALTSQECSAKYQAAKKDGSLGTTKWNDFRKAQCGADATPAAAPTAAAPAAPPPPAEPKTAAKKEAAPAAAPAPTMPSMPMGNAVFPNAAILLRPPARQSGGISGGRVSRCAGSPAGPAQWLDRSDRRPSPLR